MSEMSKEQRVKLLDPNRHKQAISMATLPGGPQNNNPMNIPDREVSMGSFTGVNQTPYGDFGFVNDPRAGTGAVMPAMNSGLPQVYPMGRGYNGDAPYNLQEQPPSKFEEMLEGGRLGFEAKRKGLVSNQYMGMIGLPAQVAPGGVVPSNQQSGYSIPLSAPPTEALPPAGGMNTKSGKRG